MTEAMRNIRRLPEEPAPAAASAANSAALRWAPGPDELHLPSCEDEPVPQNTHQAVEVEESFGSLRLHFRGRRDVFVGSDQFVHWDPAYGRRGNTANPPAAPDLYVAFGVANRHRSSYVAWEEGKPPDFVLEVVSPSSRRKDRREKPPMYAKMGVPEFFLYDPQRLPEPLLRGFELRGGRYEPLPEETMPGGVVGVRSKVLGLCLCVRPAGRGPLDGRLHWYDPRAGGFLPTRHELADDKREAVARAAAFEARVAELEALLEKMRRG